MSDFAEVSLVWEPQARGGAAAAAAAAAGGLAPHSDDSPADAAAAAAAASVVEEEEAELADELPADELPLYNPHRREQLEEETKALLDEQVRACVHCVVSVGFSPLVLGSDGCG